MSEGSPYLQPTIDEAIDARVRPLASLFASSDLVKLRVRDDEGEVVLRAGLRSRSGSAEADAGHNGAAPSGSAAIKLDVVKADLVGIMHFARPVPNEGASLEEDHELGYVEALGIRNPVRSRGPGRLVAINVSDGQAVDYGQALFTIDRNS